MIKHTFVMIFFLGLFAALSSPAFAGPIGGSSNYCHPVKHQKKVAQQGRVFICSSMTSAADEQFDRIQSMVSTGTIMTDST